MAIEKGTSIPFFCVFISSCISTWYNKLFYIDRLCFKHSSYSRFISLYQISCDQFRTKLFYHSIAARIVKLLPLLTPNKVYSKNTKSIEWILRGPLKGVSFMYRRNCLNIMLDSQRKILLKVSILLSRFLVIRKLLRPIQTIN